MNELKWYWAYTPYLDEPDRQAESATNAGYNKVVFKSEADAVINDLQTKLEVADKASTNLVHQLAEQRIQIAELEKQINGIPVWHSVSDCKPTEDTRVLVLVDVLRKGVKFIQIDTYTREDGFASTRVPRFKTYGEYVTHWMYLPKEP